MWNMETLLSPARILRAHTTARHVRPAALRGSKKPMPRVMPWICPRRSGLSIARKSLNQPTKGKQMTVELSTDASLADDKSVWLAVPSIAKGHTAQALSRLWVTRGLSRMKGNFHVRFLEGGGLATARLHSTLEHRVLQVG